jgi:hypothetical protein
VVVGAAAHQPEPRAGDAGGQPRRVAHDLLLIGAECRVLRFQKAHGLRGNDVHQRAALDAGEYRAVEVFRVLRAAEHEPAPRSAQGLVRRAGDEV